MVTGRLKQRDPFLRQYSLHIDCQGNGDLRTRQVVQFLKQSQSIFRTGGWDYDGKINLTQTGVAAICSTLQTEPDAPDDGAVIWNPMPIRSESAVYATIMTGSSALHWDTYKLTFSVESRFPELRKLLKLFSIFEPFEAYISSLQNWNHLDGHERNRLALPNHPGIAYWCHYLGPEIVAAIGGVEHILKTPAYLTKRMGPGVYVQLTEDWFDPENEAHLEIQRRAMDHWGLPREVPQGTETGGDRNGDRSSY